MVEVAGIYQMGGVIMLDRIHPLLTEREFCDWITLEQLIESIDSTVEKGDVFEQFCYFYFSFFSGLYQIETVYSDKVPGHWIPDKVKAKLHLSQRDDGVDGVFRRIDGTWVAYQAKFRTLRRSPNSNELNNFWAEAEYADYRIVISNSVSLPVDAERRRNNGAILGYMFDELDVEFFEYLYNEANATNAGVTQPVSKFQPREYQQEMVDATVAGFKDHDRGKIIAACAAGKTLVALWVSEALNTNRVIFFTPNLALVRQTIVNWTRNANTPFVYLAVCSDETVSSGIDDSFTISARELDIPVTTDASVIADFLHHPSPLKKVLFSTYQSVDCIIDAVKLCDGEFCFDFAVYDEAHRTAGAGNSGLFGKALEDENIPVIKRLFMTATERLVKPSIREKMENNNRVVFSMDDYSKYGKVFYRLPFGKAIEQGIIADYQIVVAVMNSEEMESLIAHNRFLTLEKENRTVVDEVEAQLAFKVALFSKVMNTVGATKAISFHADITAAKRFAAFMEKWPDTTKDAFISHVNGTYTAADRVSIFRDFENSEFGLITNVRCLTEGVDIPYIDAIMFSDPRNSLIDIVQAVGRALRKPYGVSEKTSYIIVPVLVDEETETFLDDAYSTMHSVIQALRDQDEMLADWIDQLNMGVVRGGGGGQVRGKGKIRAILSESIDVDQFYESIAARISQFNTRPTGSVHLGSTLGRHQRGSGQTRSFRTLCDYNAQKLKESLIDPTIGLFRNSSSIATRTELIINNNNVSHTERLGIISKEDNSRFILTQLGRQYKNGEVSFDSLFRRQILLYSHITAQGSMHPYRAACRVLMHVGTLNFIEFLYGIYTMQGGSEDDSVDQAIQIILLIRDCYPNIMLTSVGNQDELREVLNGLIGIDFKQADVWTDRTTTGNQYRYFLNHIGELSDCFDIDLDSKEITATHVDCVRTVLQTTMKYLDKPGAYQSAME